MEAREMTVEFSDWISVLALFVSIGAVWYTRKTAKLKNESVKLERFRQAPRLEIDDMRNAYIELIAFQLKNVGGYGRIESLMTFGEYSLELSSEEISLGEGSTISITCMQLFEYLENPYSDKNQRSCYIF